MVKQMAWVVLALGLAGCQSGLVPEGAWVQKVSSGYKFTEGPVADGSGNIYFSDIPNNRIMKYDVRERRESVYRENTGGANGLRFDKDGRLYACEGVTRRITRYYNGKVEPVATLAPFADRLNSPNDIRIDNKGGVYFTDPRYGNRDSMEMKAEAVYYVPPPSDGKPQDGKLAIKRVVDNLKRPNGLTLSPDGHTLFVADNASNNIWAYDVQSDGSVKNGRVFAWVDPNVKGGVDGMTVDRRGRVYGAAQGTIWVWDAKGVPIKRIFIPEPPSNCVFGGPNGDELYVTARTSLYRVRLNAETASR
jgi:sugar lactone lactonase YvrE